MVLNVDCVRAVLMQVEELTKVEVQDDGLVALEPFSINALYENLPSYSHEDIYYSVLMLSEAEYLLMEETHVMGGVIGCFIVRLTYQGHEFLGKIKDSDHWSLVHRAFPAIRDYSLSAISAIAEGITKAALDKHFAI